MRDYIGYSNGEWIPDSQFSIDPDDLGYILGAVVFETLRTFNANPSEAESILTVLEKIEG